jgi:hypothetical protein
MLLAGAATLVTLAAAAPARADWDHDGWRRHEWREHEWREHEWREHEWREHHPVWGYQYAPPPPVYYAPRVYYAPPPVVYWNR